jgi:hypothetical protein
MGRLQGENPPVPIGIMGEADVIDFEIGLPSFPFRRPGEMGFVELLAKLGNLDRIGIRKKNPEHGDSDSSQDQCARPGQIEIPLGFALALLTYICMVVLQDFTLRLF